MSVSNKERFTNLELYRIICMILIISHHYVVNSGLWSEMNATMDSPNSIYLYLFGMWGKICINCFVLITGYFMCTSTISLIKFIRLFIQIFFYNFVIYSIFVLLGKASFPPIHFLLNIWPINGINQNFGSCFLVFYLTIPFLNILVQNMTKRKHQLLLLLLLFFYSIMAIPYLNYNVTFNYVSWFVILYLISSSLRLYPIKNDKSVRFWGLMAFISIVSCITSVLYLIYKEQYPYKYVMDSNQLLALICGICSFMFFKNIKIKQSKIINIIASTTFGILLIHANNDIMRQWLWRDTVDCVGHYGINTLDLIVYSSMSVLIIFIICSIIELLRIRFIEKPFLRWLTPKIQKYEK